MHTHSTPGWAKEELRLEVSGRGQGSKAKDYRVSGSGGTRGNWTGEAYVFPSTWFAVSASSAPFQNVSKKRDACWYSSPLTGTLACAKMDLFLIFRKSRALSSCYGRNHPGGPSNRRATRKTYREATGVCRFSPWAYNYFGEAPEAVLA